MQGNVGGRVWTMPVRYGPAGIMAQLMSDSINVIRLWPDAAYATTIVSDAAGMTRRVDPTVMVVTLWCGQARHATSGLHAN